MKHGMGTWIQIGHATDTRQDKCLKLVYNIDGQDHIDCSCHI